MTTLDPDDQAKPGIQQKPGTHWRYCCRIRVVTSAVCMPELWQADITKGESLCTGYSPQQYAPYWPLAPLRLAAHQARATRTQPWARFSRRYYGAASGVRPESTRLQSAATSSTADPVTSTRIRSTVGRIAVRSWPARIALLAGMPQVSHLHHHATFRYQSLILVPIRALAIRIAAPSEPADAVRRAGTLQVPGSIQPAERLALMRASACPTELWHPRADAIHPSSER